MQKHSAFPQVAMLEQKCGYSCHVTCMLPKQLIWQWLAPLCTGMKH